MKTSTIDVHDMLSGSSVDEKEKRLGEVSGVESATVNFMAKIGWFAVRPSGTESIYKLYAESVVGTDHLRRVLKDAQLSSTMPWRRRRRPLP